MLEAHRVALLRSGGRPGIHDLSLIESAIARPYTGYYQSIYRKAAALTESLAKNHGFVDGNKRAALLTLILFLDRSGYELVGPKIASMSKRDSMMLTVAETDAMILAVVENHLTFEELVVWLREHVRSSNTGA